jgi:hypothetical protein
MKEKDNEIPSFSIFNCGFEETVEISLSFWKLFYSDRYGCRDASAALLVAEWKFSAHLADKFFPGDLDSA